LGDGDEGGERLSVPYDGVVGWFKTFAATIAENKAYLTDLDSAIGDADHGINMDRGMQAALAKVDGLPPGDVGAFFKTVGMTLVSTVGGAGGPLYGTLFLQLGTATAGKAELTAEDWSAALSAAVEGVQARGKAVLEDKTMVDALIPARDALAGAVAEGLPRTRPRPGCRLRSRSSRARAGRATWASAAQGIRTPARPRPTCC
jgi:dihydroxyacetone kinase-like protein